MEMALQIEHVAMSVNNLEESVAWYRDILGFEMVSCQAHPEINARVAILTSPAIRLELFQHDRTIPLPEIRKMPQTDLQEQGVKHFCLATGNLEQTMQNLREKHVEIVLGPDVFENRRFLYIHDVNGILIEIMEMAAQNC